jgi:hypothetical protein
MLRQAHASTSSCFDKLMLRQAHASTSSCFDKLSMTQGMPGKDDAAFSSVSGWKAQKIAAEQSGPAYCSTQACTSQDVEAAFEWLASPVTSAATRDAEALVILTQDP